MIKKRFFIEFENYENKMSTSIQISEKEYNKQLKFLREQIVKTEDDDIPIEECKLIKGETKTTVSTTIRFRSGLADVYLTKEETKEGYRFLTDKELKTKERD